MSDPDLFSTQEPEPAADPCAGCARMEDPAQTVVLLTGKTVCTWCPGWMAETKARQEEANWVLKMQDRDTRRAHLEDREAEFGAEYRQRLERVVMDTWERRRRAVMESQEAAE